MAIAADRWTAATGRGGTTTARGVELFEIDTEAAEFAQPVAAGAVSNEIAEWRS
jgi:hypothetical protein